MRKLFFVFLYIIIFSCNSEVDTLPKSTGSSNEIVVVATDILWEGNSGRIIRELFTKDYPGLQQSEPFFNVVRINPNEFTSIFKTHQHIILLSKTQNEGIIKNKWANPQIVSGMKWNNENNEKEFLKKGKNYREVFYKNQLNRVTEKFKEINHNIKNNFEVDVKIPSEYTIITDTTNIFWSTFNPKKSDLIKQILVFNLNINKINFNEKLFNKTDSVLASVLKGANENNFVQIERRFPIHINNNIYRGQWKMANDFMGGPFLMKTYPKTGNETIVTIGMVFAPGKNKKRFMLEMEALL